jgi:hypothetical protein
VNWRLIVNRVEHEWRNPAKPLNVGIRHAKGRHIFISSPETVWVGDVPGLMSSAWHAQPGNVMVAKVFSMDGEFFHKHGGQAEHAMARAEVCGHSTNIGGGILIPRYVLNELCGFDERFERWGYEDASLRQRLALYGMPTKALGSANVIHIHHEAAPRDDSPAWVGDMLNNIASVRWCGDDDWGKDFNEIVFDYAAKA